MFTKTQYPDELGRTNESRPSDRIFDTCYRNKKGRVFKMELGTPKLVQLTRTDLLIRTPRLSILHLGLIWTSNYYGNKHFFHYQIHQTCHQQNMFYKNRINFLAFLSRFNFKCFCPPLL